MAFEFNSICRFNATSTGTGDFVVASAVAGYKTPEVARATDGKVYHYFARNADGSVWEEGYGAYTYLTHTQARTTIKANSDNTTAKISFSTVPIVEVFPSPLPLLEIGEVPAGSRMLFWQAAAPLGWTKLTTHNDKALRVVSGTGGGSGGSVAFSTVFGRTSTDGFTLTTTEIPSHQHSEQTWQMTSQVQSLLTGGVGDYLDQKNQSTGAIGGSGSHYHGIDLRVHYVDLIICEKD